MQRRKLLFLTPLIPLGVFVSRHLKALDPRPQGQVDFREKALRLNQLAAAIITPADSRMLIDFVADLFSKQLPPSVVSNSMRARVAEAEFRAVANPKELIPEHRIAEAWNAYANTIKAPLDRQVTASEIHNLRDAFFTTAQLDWKRGGRNIWTVPAIYATRDGELADGCRAIESARVLWDLANMPSNLEAARVRVSQGLLTSELFRKAQNRPESGTSRSYVSASPGRPNPVEYAEREYVTRNGVRAFGRAVATMLDQTLG